MKKVGSYKSCLVPYLADPPGKSFKKGFAMSKRLKKPAPFKALGVKNSSDACCEIVNTTNSIILKQAYQLTTNSTVLDASESGFPLEVILY
jgi:hypothetical protein